MRIKDVEKRNKLKIQDKIIYKYCYFVQYDFSILGEIMHRKKNGSKKDDTYNMAYIMLDTESSKSNPTKYDKKNKPIPQNNHICIWTISIRAYNENFCTLRGSTPSELMYCLQLIRENLKGTYFYIFVHNLPWDWQFLRRFFFRDFGNPKSQLNVKSHYPISIKFENGMILRDSLILAGVSLETWANNLDVEHKKVKECWNYDLIRDQKTFDPSYEELLYIEHDTLAGVECLNKLADNLHDTVISLPYTNTGIVRRHIRKIGRDVYAKQNTFNRQLTTYSEQQILECVYHGGFTHANRHCTGYIYNRVKCKDFKSSYPYSMLTVKAPCESFYHMSKNLPIEKIINDDKYSYIFRLVLINPILRDYNYPMPVLQAYKCISMVDPIIDNGRILAADLVEIQTNEIDAKLIYQIYKADEILCFDIMAARKDYIPRWYRDAVFEVFKEKCEMEYQIKVKGEGDKSLYNLIKARLNSLYGMCVTKPVKEDIIEVYEDEEGHPSGDYYISDDDMKKKFDKYLKDRNNILPYVWGIYVTSESMYRLFELSKCIDDINRHWLYSDTDSIYSDAWNEDRLNQFNENIKNKLISAGYGPVIIEDRTYWIGTAEDDGDYDEFITQGSKRYAFKKNGKIGITVAGVPKKNGGYCLRSLDQFEEGFKFYGQGTGKKTHTYLYHDIDIDENGNEYADSIDLTENDYTLSVVDSIPINELDEDIEDILFDWFEED